MVLGNMNQYFLWVLMAMLAAVEASADTAQGEQSSNGNEWSKGDVVELVTLVIGIPAGLAALVALGGYANRHRYLQLLWRNSRGSNGGPNQVFESTFVADANLSNEDERRLTDEILRMSRQETDLIRDFQEEYGRTNAQVEGEREQWQEVLELSVVRRVVTPMFERNVYDMV